MGRTVEELRQELKALEQRTGQSNSLPALLVKKLRDARSALDRGELSEARRHLVAARKVRKIQRNFSTGERENAMGH